jgi:hypothetical protein
MLAPLVINLLSICIVMLAFGWAIDIVSASPGPVNRDRRMLHG